MKSATRESRTSARAKAAKMAAALGLLIALVTTGSARAEIATPEQKEGLYARRVSAVRRGDSECAGDYRLSAAAKGQPQRRLPGGVRAVSAATAEPDAGHCAKNPQEPLEKMRRLIGEFFKRKGTDVTVFSQKLCASRRAVAGPEGSRGLAGESDPGTGGID